MKARTLFVDSYGRAATGEEAARVKYERWKKRIKYETVPRPIGPLLTSCDFSNEEHTPGWSWAAAICERSLQLEALIADYDLATDRWDPMWPRGHCVGGGRLTRTEYGWLRRMSWETEFERHPLRRAAWREYFEARGN